MKRSPILLGSRITDETEESKKGQRRGSIGADDDDDMVTVSYELLKPDQVCCQRLWIFLCSHLIDCDH
jgi:hypothetical protein